MPSQFECFNIFLLLKLFGTFPDIGHHAEPILISFFRGLVQQPHDRLLPMGAGQEAGPHIEFALPVRELELAILGQSALGMQ